MAEYGGGPEAYIYLTSECDPAWVDAMYFTILRRRQMEELRMISEDEWPEPSALIDYNTRYPADVDYYNGEEDLIMQLSMWLRDHRIRNRKEAVRNKNQAKQRDIMNSLG